MRLFHHGRFVDMERDGDAVIVSDRRKFLHVFDIRAADVGVEEKCVAIPVLAFHKIVEMRAHMLEGLRQARFLFDSIDREIDRGDSGVGEPVDYRRLQQTGIRGQVNPEVLLRGIIDDFVHEIRPQERLSTRRRKHAARSRVQPINRATGDILAHSLHAVVVGPAIMTIQIAFPLRE